jgi:hypothetical protein
MSRDTCARCLATSQGTDAEASNPRRASRSFSGHPPSRTACSSRCSRCTGPWFTPGSLAEQSRRLRPGQDPVSRWRGCAWPRVQPAPGPATNAVPTSTSVRSNSPAPSSATSSREVSAGTTSQHGRRPRREHGRGGHDPRQIDVNDLMPAGGARPPSQPDSQPWDVFLDCDLDFCLVLSRARAVYGGGMRRSADVVAVRLEPRRQT